VQKYEEANCMSIRRPKTDTIRRLQRDDLAKHAVIQFQQNPALLQQTESNPILRQLKQSAQDVKNEKRRPRYIAEWIAVVMYFGDEPWVATMRRQANADADAIYIRAVSWLRMVDDKRKTSNKTDH
jgi:hypothetical protein